MLKSVASEVHKRGNQALHFVNANKKMAKVITATLPSADIAFVPNVINMKHISPVTQKHEVTGFFSNCFSGGRGGVQVGKTGFGQQLTQPVAY